MFRASAYGDIANRRPIGIAARAAWSPSSTRHRLPIRALRTTMIIQLTLMQSPGSLRKELHDPDDRLIDVGVGWIVDLPEHRRRREPRMDPPPAVLDGPLDLHQVLEGVEGEGKRHPEIATPAFEDHEQNAEGDGRLGQERQQRL